MGKSKSQFKRYKVIDELLQGGNKIKTKTIRKVLTEQHDISVSSRMIQKDINSMRFDPILEYFAPIEDDPKTKSWYYTDPNYSISKKLSIKEKESEAFLFYLGLLKRYSNNNHFEPVQKTLKEIIEKHTLSKKFSLADINDILLVSHPPITTNYDQIIKIITAILDCFELKFTYKKYSSEPASKRTFHPCIIQEYEDRWYVSGLETPNTKIKTFALDRISNMQVTSINFKKPVINWEEYFKSSIGVTVGDYKTELIKLSFSPNQKGYLKSRPIHPTQIILEESNKEIILTIETKATWELFAKILSYGASVKVLEPKAVRKAIKQRISAMLKQYQ